MIRRSATIALEIVAGLLLVAGIAAGALAWRLSRAPLDIGFLAPTVEAVLARDLPVRVDIGRALLAWGGRGQPLEVRALDIRSRNPAGELVAALPELRVGFSLPALAVLRIAPARIVLVEPGVRLVQDAEGRISFVGAEALDPDQDDSTSRLLAEMVDALRRPPDPTHPLGALTELRILRATASLTTQRSGLTWTAPQLDLTLLRDKRGVYGNAAAEIRLGDKTHHVEAGLLMRSDDGAIRIDSRFENVPVADLALALPDVTPLAGVELPLSGQAGVELSGDLKVAALELDVRGGPGTISVPEHLERPLDLQALALKGRLSDGGRRATLERLSLDFGVTGLTAKGQANRAADAWSLAVEGTVTGLPVADLGRFWPQGVLRNTRKWMLENVADGRFERVAFAVDGTAPIGAPEALKTSRTEAQFDFSGATVTYFKGLPPVRGVTGTASFSGPALALKVTSGTLLDMALQPSDILIHGLDTESHLIDIKVPLKGPLRSALTVIDSPPLRYAQKVNLVPAETGGDADLVLTFAFPLVADLKMDQVSLRAEGTVTQAAAAGIVPGIAVGRGDARIVVTRDRLELDGTAELNGVPAKVAWQENFDDSQDIWTRVAVVGTADNAQRRAFGLELPDWLAGPVGLDLVYTRDRHRVESIAADVDLTPAELRIDMMDWHKPPGQPGAAALTVGFDKGRPRHVPRLAVRTGELQATGSLDLDAETLDVRRARLDGFRLLGTNLALDLEIRPDGGLVADARGRSLDFQALRRGLRGKPKEPLVPGPAEPAAPADEPPPPPLQVAFDLEQVIMGDEGEALREARGAARRTGRWWEEASLDARVSDTGTLRVRYWPEDGGYALTAESDDAGASLTQLGLLSHIKAGRLTVTGRSDPKDPRGTVSGRLDMRDYKVIKAPVSARLLSALGPRGFARFMEGEPIAFDRLEGEFHWRSDGIAFRDVRTSGSAIGLTLEGNVNLQRDVAELQGTIVPVSDINRLLGSLPLVGDLLVGGEGQGLFAATYSVKGPLADPQISVNPLAVLAPGFLRNLFFRSAPAGEGATVPKDQPVPGQEPPQHR